MLHQGFTVFPWYSNDLNKTNHDPKKAMLYNMKNVNLKYNTNNLLDKWWKPLEMVAGNWRKLQTASLDSGK